MANKKTKLQTRWEQSFQDFDELSGSRRHCRQHGDGEAVVEEEEEEAVCIQDEETTVIRGHGDCSDMCKGIGGVGKALSKQKTPASQEIDNFIQGILDPATCQEENFISKQWPNAPNSKTNRRTTPVSTPGSTHSIDSFIRTVLVPFPQQNSECSHSGEATEGCHLPTTFRSQRSNEESSQDSALLFSSSSTDGSVADGDIADLKEKFISLPSDTVELVDEETSFVISPDTGSVTSQLIESTATASVKLEEGAVSEGPTTQFISNSVGSQAIHNEMNDSLNQGLLEMTYSSAAASSAAAQTPDIHSKLSGVVREEEFGDVDSDPTKKLKITGMAEQLARIIKREQSDHSIARHELAMSCNRALDTESTVDIQCMKLVVTASVIDVDSLIDCVVVSCPNDSLSVGTQAKLAATSLGIEGNAAGRGEEVTLYWPWRVFNSIALGPVIFCSSYCEVKGLPELSGHKQVTKATETVTTITTSSCPCRAEGRHGIYPVYEGPYAFLHQ